MIYSKPFERDIRWFMKMRNLFSFDGQVDAGYVKKQVIIYRNGVEFNRISLRSFEEQFPHLCSKNSIKQCHDGMFNSWDTILFTEPLIVPDKNGVDGIEAFYNIDTLGKILPTKHPTLLRRLLKTKSSINLFIDMYADDRSKGRLPLIEFRGMCIQWKAPEWFYFAVEKAKHRYWKNDSSLPDWFMDESKKQLERYSVGLKH